MLARNLCGRPPVVQLFSEAGRCWLAGLELPADELLTLEGCLRQIDFLHGEIQALEAVLARHALQSAEIRRLVTIPGVNVLTAAAFMASVGDIGRFPTPRKLGQLPRVSIPGCASRATSRPATGGSPRPVPPRPGTCSARWPRRSRARRGRCVPSSSAFGPAGAQVAATATARKLVVLFWQLLSRGEDYAFQRPSMTRNKIRQLELAAGAKPRKGKPTRTNSSPRLADRARLRAPLDTSSKRQRGISFNRRSVGSIQAAPTRSAARDAGQFRSAS